MQYVRRTALFVLEDEKGRLLIQHRSKDAKRHPNYWGFFGGGIEEGETPEDAVKREAKEELGLDLKDLKFFRRYEQKQEDGFHEKFVFIASLNCSIEELRKHQKEGQGLELFFSKDLDNLKISEYSLVIFKDLFNRKK